MPRNIGGYFGTTFNPLPRHCAHLAAVVGLAFSVAWPVAAAPDARPEEGMGNVPTLEQPSPKDVPVAPDDVELLKDRSAPREARSAALNRLMWSVDPLTRTRLAEILATDAPSDSPSTSGPRTEPPRPLPGTQPAAPPPGPDASTLAFEEIVAGANAPPWLITPLSQQLRRGTPERRSLAVMALSSIRTRESVRALLALLGEADTPPTVAEAAYRSLARLTGRDFGSELKSWSLWFTQVEWQPEAEWRRLLAEGLATRVESATRERDRATTRLIDELKKTYAAASTVDARSAMLESLIRDDLLPVRRLGFSLALQELANARGLDQRVARTALDVMRDTNVETRRSAAELLNVLASANLAPALRDALASESDARAAGSLLRVVARWPDDADRPVAMRWLCDSGDNPARGPAMDDLAALLDSKMLRDPADRARVLSVVRRTPPSNLPASGLRLLFALGEDADRSHVLELITTGDAERRRAVADTLVPDPRALDPIVKAAKTDLLLCPVAAAALAAHRANADGFQTLAELPAASAESRRQALLAFAAKLKPGDLLTAAGAVRDPSLSEAMLARLTTEPLIRRFDQNSPGMSGALGQSRYMQNPSVAAGLLLLCRTRLELGQPAAALKALDALAPVSDRVDAAQYDAMRTVALLWLNRVDDALATHGSLDSWVDGLERSMGQQHAAAILRVIDGRFGSEMPPELVSRLRPLRDKLEMSVGPQPERP